MHENLRELDRAVRRAGEVVEPGNHAAWMAGFLQARLNFLPDNPANRQWVLDTIAAADKAARKSGAKTEESTKPFNRRDRERLRACLRLLRNHT